MESLAHARKSEKKKTSTPVKRMKGHYKKAPEMKIRKRTLRKASRSELYAAKKKLDEGLQVSLEHDPSFETSQEGSQSSHDREGERHLSQEIPDFDTTTSSILSELRAVLEDVNQTGEDQNQSLMGDSSDPNITSFLLSLVGGSEEKFSNPFQLSENIKRELVMMAEHTGARALAWDLSLFNKVGGNGTLTSVWNRLKSSSMVRGMKRSLSTESEGEKEHKKLRISLNCLHCSYSGLRIKAVVKPKMRIEPF